MKFGLTDDQYQFLRSVVSEPLEQMGARIWCFGSRARGDFGRFSDLDLMVEADTDLSAEIGKILEKISNSNFPYKVDLVELHDFAASYIAGFHKDKVPF